jgi:hypothetical protein
MATPSTADRLAIIDLTIAYAWALDTRDWDALRSVFLPDATAELGSPLLIGVDAIIERVRTALVPLDASQHIVANHQVSITDGDRGTASCRCYLQAQHVWRDAPGGSNLLIGGRYEDTMSHGPDGWRISHRALVVTWRDGNPAVLAPR